MSSAELLKQRFQPEQNAQKQLQEFSGTTKMIDEPQGWERRLMAVHGTTVKSLKSILRDGRIYSYRSLQDMHPEVVADRQSRATDQLDIQLGLHEFVFWNIGRVHPVHIHDVYLCAKNDFVERDQHFVAMREIVHYGALVSPEAIEVRKKLRPLDKNADIKKLNREAARKFFGTLVHGKDFPKIFSRFVSTYHHGNIANYLGSLSYPGVEPTINQIGEEGLLVSGTWEGPQLITPRSVSIDDVQSLLVTTTDAETVDAVMESGFRQDRIFRIGDAIEAYTQFWKKVIREGFGYLFDKYLFLNAALADMSDFPFNNRDNADETDNLIAFQDMRRTSL